LSAADTLTTNGDPDIMPHPITPRSNIVAGFQPKNAPLNATEHDQNLAHIIARIEALEAKVAKPEGVFVSAAGSNSHGGRSAEAPVQTLAHAISIAAPGDTIYLRRGDTWRVNAGISKSLTLDAYGSGPRPIISGANVVTVSGSANTWTGSLASEPTQVLVNGTRGERRSTTGALSGQGMWHWSGGTLTVWSSTQPAVEATARDHAVTIDNISNVTLRNLHLTNAQRGVRATRAHGLTVDNCEISNAYVQGLWLGSDLQMDNVAIRNCHIHRCGQTGIGFGGRMTGWVIEDNLIEHCAQLTEHMVHPSGRAGDFGFTSGIKIWGWYERGWVGTYTVRRNTVRHIHPVNWATTGSVLNKHACGIWLDEVYPANSGIRPKVEGNIVHDVRSRGIYLEKVDFHDIIGNILYNCAQNDFGAAITIEANKESVNKTTWQPADVANSCVGNLVRRNTVYHSSGANSWAFYAVAQDVVAGRPCRLDNNTVQDNIFFRPTNVCGMFLGGGRNDGANGSGNVYSSNSWGPQRSNWMRPNAWDAAVSTYTALHSALAATSPSVQGDPLMVDPAGGNFALRTNSPAMGSASDGGNLGAV
jgi:hypothetical protein